MSIETDTVLLPAVVADVVVSRWIDWLLPNFPDIAQKATDKDRELATYLYEKAEWHYGHALLFRAALQSNRKNRARDTLYAFMFHWMTAGMIRSFPQLRGRVPGEINGTGGRV